jgi:hypothetical protein
MMFFIALLRGLHRMGCRVLCIEKSGIETNPERRGEAESGIIGEYSTGSNLSLVLLGVKRVEGVDSVKRRWACIPHLSKLGQKYHHH